VLSQIGPTNSYGFLDVLLDFVKPYQLQNLTKHLKNHMNL